MFEITLTFKDWPSAWEQKITVKRRAWTGGSPPKPLNQIYGLERALVRHFFREQVTEWTSFWKTKIPLDIARVFWGRARGDAFATRDYASEAYPYRGMIFSRVDYRGRVYDNYHVRRDPTLGPGWYIFGRSPDYQGILTLVARPDVKPRKHPHYSGQVRRGWLRKKDAESALKLLPACGDEHGPEGVRHPPSGGYEGQCVGSP